MCLQLRTAVLAATFDIVFPAAAILSSELTLDRETQISTAGLLSSIFSTVAYGSPLSAMVKPYRIQLLSTLNPSFCNSI